VNAREVALQTVRDVFASEGAPGRGAQEALEYRASKAGLDPRDRAFCTQLVFGAIKMRRALDWFAHPFVGARSKALPPVILEIVRLALYELHYTSAADHAVVSQWVNLAKRYGHRGTAGLVNAVLRSFLRYRPQPPVREDFESDDDFLGTLFSYPTWLVRQWRAVFGSRLEELLAACNEPAQPAITVNRMRTSREKVRASFEERGVTARISEIAEDSVLLESGAAAAANDDRDAGAWWIQSESSAAIVDILNPQPSERVADACSGRGNKALQIAARLGDAPVHCIDRDARKLATLEDRAAAAGLQVVAEAGDAAAPAPGPRFDRVLLDAPCSGTGVVGRHPEARWRKRPDDGERLALTQRALLDALVPQLFEGGAIVYAVCSTDPRETTEVIEWCLRAHNVERGLIPAHLRELQTGAGDVLIPPGLHGRDGFYAARLERR